MIRRLVAAAGAAAAVVALAAPAYAAGGRITQVESKGAELRLVFTPEALPAGTTLDTESVHVTVEGAEIPSHAEVVTQESVRRAAELVIDTSGSMRGEGIQGAKSAARAFVDNVPADVEVGLVTFADTAAVRVPPTKDKAALRRAIDGLAPNGETSLYDGVLLGLRELGITGVRSMLVLSDGADTRSRQPLGDVLTAARVSGSRIDTVAFKTPEATGQVLTQISTASKGRAIAAGRAADVAKAFGEAARAISNQVVVTATLPEGTFGSVTIGVSARAGELELTDTVAASVDARPTATPKAEAGPVDVDPGTFGSKAVLYGALAAVFVALALVLLLAFGSLTPDRQQGRVRRRLSLYTLTGRGAAEVSDSTALGDSGVARSALELADRVVRGRGDVEARLGTLLERAGSALKPAEWILIHASATFGAALLLLLLSGGGIVATVLGLVLGFVGPYAYLKVRAGRRANQFLAQMPDTLQLLAGSLSAGYSLPQGVDAVVREGAQPIANEFNRAIIESRLGVPIEDALDHIADRMDSQDFRWVVMAIRIQRDVGGNLAEVLTTVANTMRERERVRRQVRVLSAEGRLSAWVLGGLPPLFALYLMLVRPRYIKPLYTETLGIVMLVGAGILFVAGVLWLRKVVKVEV
ncbi:MAG TPA: type II secretion system F family protein [Mycobacteriales bacterium]|jgi:tight adherence protein B